MKQQPVPYTTYIYLTRIDLSGGPEVYSLHIVLWMPKNYTLVSSDNKAPEGIQVPEVFYHRLVLKDAKPDGDDNLSECGPIALSVENFKQPEGKDLIAVHYTVSNETRSKVPKKPKAKVAYAHADLGGAGPGPQPPEPDSAEVSINT